MRSMHTTTAVMPPQATDRLAREAHTARLPRTDSLQKWEGGGCAATRASRGFSGRAFRPSVPSGRTEQGNLTSPREMVDA